MPWMQKTEIDNLSVILGNAKMEALTSVRVYLLCLTIQMRTYIYVIFYLNYILKYNI